MATTLGDALASGQGIERPFQCPEHNDRNASASVNVLKMVWYCYGCHAKGVVDSARVPTPDELASMLAPETAAREYPQSWLTLFGQGGYWLDRFPDWLCWYIGFGEDPWTGEGTYPVHTPAGRVAGVGRRNLADTGPKYLYPKHWSASRSLFGTRGAYQPENVLLITEGAADAAAGWEVGCASLAAYGSSVHAPQVELITRMNPRLILLGQDNDEAGHRGAELTTAWLSDHAELVRVEWDADAGDPAAMEPGHRLDCLLEAVGRSGYGQVKAIRDNWRATKHAVHRAYVQENDEH